MTKYKVQSQWDRLQRDVNRKHFQETNIQQLEVVKYRSDKKANLISQTCKFYYNLEQRDNDTKDEY